MTKLSAEGVADAQKYDDRKATDEVRGRRPLLPVAVRLKDAFGSVARDREHLRRIRVASIAYGTQTSGHGSVRACVACQGSVDICGVMVSWRC